MTDSLSGATDDSDLTSLHSRHLVEAIRVDHLNKVFRQKHYSSIKRAVFNLLRAEKVVNYPALTDLSFSVPQGQTVAVIGRNGSGKSTLLGILARVYRPTSGRVDLLNPQGNAARIAPLLSLGAGFHLDLTAEQNIVFYGAILGLTPKEIAKKRDEIVAFSELEDKMDTALHGWNDGAKLRLGFSIAVHIDPDILLVDEVLAVGDESFQNKCYRFIAQLQRAGKTILFVSHDLSVVERVANRILWLQNGVIRMDGSVEEVLTAYREDAKSAPPPPNPRPQNPGEGE